MSPHEILSPLLAANAESATVIDVGIMKVGYKALATVTQEERDAVDALVAKKEGSHCACNLMDGDEHNYMEVGAWIGDQHDALVLMGWLELAGKGEVRHPRKMLPGISEQMRKSLLERGYVTFKAKV